MLIVEDDPALARMSARLAASLGWVATVVASPSSALDALAEGAFDLVISDVGLGEEDGVALASALKRRTPDLPVIMMSGDPDNLARALKAGLPVTLAKPFDRGALQAALDRALPGT